MKCVGFSTPEMVGHVLLAGVIGAALFAIRAMRAADRMISEALALLDVEDEEPLAAHTARGPWSA